MSRERSHKGSGRPRKRPTKKDGLNDRRQEAGTNTQIVKQEEEREGAALLGTEPGERTHP
jgi:hypothetical protein